MTSIPFRWSLLIRRGATLAWAVIACLAPEVAGAQTLGTFRWQLQPYCNGVSLTVTQLGSTYRVEGTDDLCGAGEQASVTGMAFLNPAGNIGFGLTVVAPGAAPIHVAATISTTTYSGTWQDDAGNSGPFILNGAAAGPLRPISNQTRIAIAHVDWEPQSNTNPITTTRFSSLMRFQRTSVGTNFLVAGGLVPVTVNGRRQELLGLELCYRASTSAVLDFVELNTTTHTTASPTGRTQRLFDDTDRTDTACRFYPVSVPYVLAPNDAVNAFISVNWTVASASFELGRATLVLRPTTASAGSVPDADEAAVSDPSPTSTAYRPRGR